MPGNSHKRGERRRQQREATKSKIEGQYGVKIVNSRPANIGTYAFRSQNEATAYDRAKKFNRYGK